jgi:hypothetical protein
MLLCWNNSRLYGLVTVFGCTFVLRNAIEYLRHERNSMRALNSINQTTRQLRAEIGLKKRMKVG